MLFQVYGDNAIYQWIGWILVFCCLIGANELARRTKTGGVIAFLVIPAVLTVYFITIYTAAAMGADWALNNPTYVHMTSWFHYAKLYAATIGCIGFMALKYKAGLLNIFCMTGWFGIYASKKKDDMLWPDMTWVFIVAYDLWNFCYTYNCLPTHSWFCGFALLLAPTVAAFIWNKGGWIQNRAFTLAIWCMFAQVFPYFQEESIFVTHSTLDAGAATAVSVVALIANIAAIIYIAYRAKKLGRNPYKQDVFEGTSDWEKATARRAKVDYAHAE